jgi:hypothetical protein
MKTKKIKLTSDLNNDEMALENFLKIKIRVIFFQPKGIKLEYCEIGMIYETDPDYIWYLDEPCKILKSAVKIIENENVIFDKKNNLYKLKKI